MELNIYSLDVRICNYALDNNGNMIQRSNTTLDGTYRRCCWDEENRLMAVADFRNGNPVNTSAYIYNAGGERVWKFAGAINEMMLNGKDVFNVAALNSSTLYTSPYMVATDENYTKHYFIENERICSKACAELSRSIGGGFGNVVNPTEPANNASFIDRATA